MSWYYEPGAAPYANRLWPPLVDQLAVDVAWVGSKKAMATDLRSKIQPPNMFEWRGSAANEHIAEKSAVRRQLALAAEAIAELEAAMKRAVVSCQSEVATNRAEFEAAKAARSKAAA